MSGDSSADSKLVVYPEPPPPGSPAGDDCGEAAADEVAATAPPLNVVVDADGQEGRPALAAATKQTYGTTEEARAPPPVTIDMMPPRGESVTLCGLHANYALNGAQGMVVGYRSDGAVLVKIPSEAIECAPVHPENLVWGAQPGSWADDAASPEIPGVQRRAQTSSFDGLTILKVPPSGNSAFFRSGRVARPNDPDSCCCRPIPWSDVSLFPTLLGLLLNLMLCCVSFALTLAGVMLSAFFPCFFVQFAVSWRWMAHRHVNLLLNICPPPMGVVATHPSAHIKGASGLNYLGSCHTWKCMLYLLLVAPWLSMLSLMISMFMLPLGLLIVFRPLFRIGTNVVWAMAALERTVACGILTHTVCEYDMFVRESDAQDDPQVNIMVMEGDALTEAMIPPRETAEGAPLSDLRGTERRPSPFLEHRSRTVEENMALDKFYGAFSRLFGRMGRLQDIRIDPPREPGRGPRHYVKVAESMSDSERLKLIKAYKQAFSTMYVHIIDQEEQERIEGTDYSAMYQ